MIAGALATVSRQPYRPQWHASPSRSMTTWPISPAASLSPPNSWSLRISPAPMPRPTFMTAKFAGRASPLNRYVAKAAARLSLATTVGRSWRSCEDLRQRQVLPVEADRPADRAGLVDDARRSDADAEDRGRRGGAHLVDELVDQLECLVPVPTLEVAARSRRQLAPEVRERRREGALAEVERDDRAGVGIERDEGRLLAAGARASADVLGEAIALQVADELADAGPSEAGESGDVGAGDRPEVVERTKDERGVVRARLGVGGLRREFRAFRSPHAGFAPLQACRANTPTTSSADWTKRILARVATLSIARTKCVRAGSLGARDHSPRRSSNRSNVRAFATAQARWSLLK